MTELCSPSLIQMPSYDWAKPIATQLLLIRMNRPFVAKVMINYFHKMVDIGNCFGLIGASSVYCS